MNIPMEIYRSENAGENKKLEQCCSSAYWKFGVNFEYTARENTQQNSDAEFGILTIVN